MTAEECQQLLQSLQDVDLVKVACLKLEGWTNEAIADEMKYTRRTIQRMLKISEVPGRRRLTGRLRPDGKLSNLVESSQDAITGRNCRPVCQYAKTAAVEVCFAINFGVSRDRPQPVSQSDSRCPLKGWGYTRNISIDERVYMHVRIVDKRDTSGFGRVRLISPYSPIPTCRYPQ